MRQAVFCIAQNIDQAEHIVSQLKLAGFSNNDISVLFPNTSGIRDLAGEKPTKAPEDAAIGGTDGVGAVLGRLAGIGSLAIPGAGPFIAAGPIMGALSAATVGAATGGLIGSLIGLGIPEYEAKRYQDKISDGNALLSVHADSYDELVKAKKIFEQAHAEDISSTAEADANV